MHIESKIAAVCYRVLLGVLAAVGWLWLQPAFSDGSRVFAVWMLAIAAVYYIVSAIVLAWDKSRPAGSMLFPRLEGAILIGFLIVGGTAIASLAADFDHPMAEGWQAGLVYASYPLLALGGWLLFVKKGSWRWSDPWYWLALPLAFAALSVLFAIMSPTGTELDYPLPFFDYSTGNFLSSLTWLGFYGTVILVGGYVLVLTDFLMSGKLRWRRKPSAKEQ